MGLGQIHHMDVVADAGAVMGGVVVAEHPQAVPASGRHLRDEREQVVGDAEGVLADAAAGVGADGIEVAQAGHPPGVVAAQGLQHLLHGQFRLGVGVNRCGGQVFPQGELLRFAVDR